ncbi:hypothetical protein [Sinorhizobium fredii]|uniref:hypothetical protein n=1 Tax=Rhizobium fredii TaxID=380 RepID=UPI003519AEAC
MSNKALSGSVPAQGENDTLIPTSAVSDSQGFPQEDAIDLIAERLRTPLQIEMHLTLAFEQGFRLGAKPVTAEIVEQILSRAIDDLEPTLTRNGYDAAALVTHLNARPSDIRAFLAGN